MLKRLLLTIIAGFTLAFTVMSHAGSTPTDDVRTSVDAMLEILKNEQLDKEGKRAQMSTVINERFDPRTAKRHISRNRQNCDDSDYHQKLYQCKAPLRISHSNTILLISTV